MKEEKTKKDKEKQEKQLKKLEKDLGEGDVVVQNSKLKLKPEDKMPSKPTISLLAKEEDEDEDMNGDSDGKLEI